MVGDGPGNAEAGGCCGCGRLAEPTARFLTSEAVTTRWPTLSAYDVQMISAALSLAKTSVSRGGGPVDASLLISALDEFYGAFARNDRTDAAKLAELAEIARVSEKYFALAEWEEPNKRSQPK